MNVPPELMVYVGQTRAARLIERLTALGIGECTARGELLPRRRPWFYDNGAFGDWTAGRPFDGPRFLSDIAWIRQDELAPDFVVAPDIVAGGGRSLEFSLLWAEHLAGLPIYVAVQDGMSTESVAEVLELFDGVFVGGTLPWKLRTGAEWVDLAHEKKKRCHVGRVGTPGRVSWARTIRADSVDSCLPLWSEANLQAFLGALSSRQGRLWAEPMTAVQP